MNKKLVLLLAACLAIRLIGLNQSLWLDEAISANVVKTYSFIEIPRIFSVHDFHPPLFYETLKAWTEIFGRSEVALRMPSVIFSLITIYLVFKMGGPGAAAVAGFNPLLVYYSQEARMYSMVTMLLTAALYCWLKKKYWWYSIWSMLAVFTFYGSVFFWVGLGTYLLWNKKFKQLAAAAAAPILGLVILSPLLVTQLRNSKEMLAEVTGWSLVLGKANLKNLLLIFIKFSSGRISFYPKAVYYLIAGGWAIIFWGLVIKRSFKEKFFGWIVAAALTAGVVFSIFTPMLDYFRFLYLIPVIALIIKKSRVVVIGSIIFSLVYVLNPTFYREDWKSLTADLGPKVYMIGSFADPVKYYLPSEEVTDIKIANPTETEIEVIPYGEAIHGFDHTQKLTKLGYKLRATKDYRGVSWETWDAAYMAENNL